MRAHELNVRYPRADQQREDCKGQQQPTGALAGRLTPDMAMTR
jgi:hypothetical protein